MPVRLIRWVTNRIHNWRNVESLPMSPESGQSRKCGKRPAWRRRYAQRPSPAAAPGQSPGSCMQADRAADPGLVSGIGDAFRSLNRTQSFLCSRKADFERPAVNDLADEKVMPANRRVRHQQRLGRDRQLLRRVEDNGELLAKARARLGSAADVSERHRVVADRERFADKRLEVFGSQFCQILRRIGRVLPAMRRSLAGRGNRRPCRIGN